MWLYGWLILRQTHQHGDLGCVLGGSPISYREIEEETGFKRRTLEGWMRVLRRGGYIETVAAPGGVVVRITKAKKFPQGVREFEGGMRKSSEGVRKVAERCTQNRVANHCHHHRNQGNADGIGSSSLVGIIDKEGKSAIPNHLPVEIHNSDHNQEQRQNQNQEQNPPQNLKSTATPSWSGSRQKQIQNQRQHQEPYRSDAERAREQYLYLRAARIRWAQLRKEREEEVRRELNVGAGPEVPRK